MLREQNEGLRKRLSELITLVTDSTGDPTYDPAATSEERRSLTGTEAISPPCNDDKQSGQLTDADAVVEASKSTASDT